MEDAGQKYFEDGLRSIQEERNKSKWEPGIPILSVCVMDHSNVLCVCQLLPFGFECSTCGCAQQIHEGNCNECGALIYISPNWNAWRDICEQRERNWCEMERRRREFY